MSKKNIKPEKIKSVKAKFDDAFINFGSGIGLIVEDDSKAKLEECFNGFKETAGTIQETIVSFNDYLDQVATAFEDTDSFLASRIEGKGDVKDYREGQNFRSKMSDEVRKNIFKLIVIVYMIKKKLLNLIYMNYLGKIIYTVLFIIFLIDIYKMAMIT